VCKDHKNSTQLWGWYIENLYNQLSPDGIEIELGDDESVGSIPNKEAILADPKPRLRALHRTVREAGEI
jgi:hypothetical protein